MYKGAYPLNLWGQQYGGVTSAEMCAKLPPQLVPGCNFRCGAGTQNHHVLPGRAYLPSHHVTCCEPLLVTTHSRRCAAS
jgi:hypothetical protein